MRSRRPVGFDPGLRIRRAATIDPQGPLYYEDCPDGPDGRCYPAVPPGGGFYTLANDEGIKGTCRIACGERYDANEWNPDVPCPYWFSWVDLPGGEVAAEISIDSTGFKHHLTPNLYLGLQENIPSRIYAGCDYLSPDQALPFEQIDSITLSLRAAASWDPDLPDPARFGRLFTYVDWLDVEKKLHTQVSLDLMHYIDADATVDVSDLPVAQRFYEESEWLRAHGEATHFNESVYCGHVDAAAWGAVPDGLRFVTTADADVEPSVDDQPWVDLDIDLRQLFDRMVDEGVLPTERLSGTWVGGIVLGLELWGRTAAVVQVKDRTMWATA